MSWSKLSDDYTDDLWRLSDRAYRLHTDGIVWNNRKLLDCRIPKGDLRRFSRHPDYDAELAELIDNGFWAEDPDVYVIVHHARYQRRRKDVLAQQAANKRNGRKGGRPPRETWASETESVTESQTEAETERDRTGQGRTGTDAEPKDSGDVDDVVDRVWPEVRKPGSGLGLDPKAPPGPVQPELRLEQP